MYTNISYKFQRIPDAQFHFITKVHDLLGQPSYRVKVVDLNGLQDIMLILNEGWCIVPMGISC